MCWALPRCPSLRHGLDNPSRHEAEEFIGLLSSVSYLSGTTVLHFLMTLILETIVACVLSGSTVVSGRKISLAPVAPLWLEAEALLLSFVKLP